MQQLAASLWQLESTLLSSIPLRCSIGWLCWMEPEQKDELFLRDNFDQSLLLPWYSYSVSLLPWIIVNASVFLFVEHVFFPFTRCLFLRRGMLARGSGLGRAVMHRHGDCYNSSPAVDQLHRHEQQPYYPGYHRAMHQSCDSVHSEARSEDIFGVPYSGSYNDLSLSSMSLNEADENTSDVSKSIACDVYQQKRTADRGDALPQPVVRLRSKKARDKVIRTERPRSWHASKQPDCDPYLSGERSMRSPASCYLGSPTPQAGFHSQPLSKYKRRSKGWSESGELKSPYRGDLDGSKDSLISGSSQRSYRSERLSVASSRSSGAMSNSRGSLDNLLDSSSNRVIFESHPQIHLTTYNSSSPSQPQTGIVSQQKSLFEKLSHGCSSNADVHVRSRNRKITSDDADKVSSLHFRENSKGSSQYSGSSSSCHSSFSPPPTVVENEISHSAKKLQDRDSGHFDYPASNWLQQTDHPNGDSAWIRHRENRALSSSEIKYSDVKILNTNSGNTHLQQSIPDPPARNISSALAVKNHQRLSHGAISEENNSTGSSPSFSSERTKSNAHYGKSPPRAQTLRTSPAQSKQGHSYSNSVSSANSEYKATVTRPSQKSRGEKKLPDRQERVFGVVSVGNGKDIIATSATSQQKPRNVDAIKERQGESDIAATASAKYELLRDSYSGNDPNDVKSYVARAANRRIETSTTSVGGSRDCEHQESISGDSTDPRSKGRYGSVWKTPRNHCRAQSYDFSSEFNGLESDHAQKLLIAKRQNSEIPTRQMTSPKEAIAESVFDETVPPGKQIDNLPVLNASQSDNGVSRQDANFEPLTSANDYEQIWYTEPSPRFENNREKEATLHQSPYEHISNYRSWKENFDKVESDEQHDDPFCHEEHYRSNIKDMSKKVLKATSFTRKDLKVSLSLQNFKQTKHPNQIPEQSNSNRQPGINHTRSRSYGNDLDEESEPLSFFPASSNGSVHFNSRPKSAGVERTTKHTPNHLTSIQTSGRTSSNNHSRKYESLPRNTVLSSYTSDDSSSPHKSPSNRSQNRRVSIDVRPDLTSPSAGQQEGLNAEKKNALLDYISRKNRKSFDKSFDELSGIGGGKISPPSNTSPVSPPGRVGSVRRVKNHKETKNKFNFSRLTSRTRSASSLLEEEETAAGSRGQRCFDHKEKSASLANLTDSGLDVSRASPCDDTVDESEFPIATKNGRSKASPFIVPLRANAELPVDAVNPAQVPPHRLKAQISNRTELRDESPSKSPSNPSSNNSSSNTLKQASVDSSTYRVAKGKTSGKSPTAKPEQDNKSGSPTMLPVAVDILKANEDNSSKENLVKSANSSSKKPSSQAKLLTTSNEALLEEVEKKFTESIDKVKRSASARGQRPKLATTKSLPPPPTAVPLDDATEKLLNQIQQRRQSQGVLSPPAIPSKLAPVNISGLPSADIKENLNENMTSATERPLQQCDTVTNEISTSVVEDNSATPIAENNKVTVAPCHENVHLNGSREPCENVFQPLKTSSSVHQESVGSPTPCKVDKNEAGIETDSSDNNGEKTEAQAKEITATSSPSPEVSPQALLPDLSLLLEPTSSRQRVHSDFTNDIIKKDNVLVQVLATSNKQMLDYMAGVLPQPSHDIIEEGIRYRRRKPTGATATKNTPEDDQLPGNDVTSHDNLPSNSTYYKTSASKAKILSMMKEKFADGEVALEEQKTFDEINHKKIELVLSIKNKLDDLQDMKSLLSVEMRENECLGKQIHNLIKSLCNSREVEKYSSLVHDVDKIINLLLSISGRLARVENTIQMLSSDAEKEMECLVDKRKKLMEQHNDAKQLKEDIDRRQKQVSGILASHFDEEQFADYEHYIKMKCALIMEQRELDDKAKLGQEQMQCLRDTLPEDLQFRLDRMTEE